jgi:hypothetical protein
MSKEFTRLSQRPKTALYQQENIDRMYGCLVEFSVRYQEMTPEYAMPEQAMMYGFSV